jgi:hypothetical protein
MMTVSHSKASTYDMVIVCNGSGRLLEWVGDRQPIQDIRQMEVLFIKCLVQNTCTQKIQ